MAAKLLIQCPDCHSRVREDRLEKHRRKVHGTMRQSPDNRSRPVRKPVEQHRTLENSGNQPIILESKRGKRTVGARRCDECGVSETVTWRYSKSNRGVVYICSRCKEKVFNRSFVRKTDVDIMDTPLVWINPFETNPHRH